MTWLAIGVFLALAADIAAGVWFGLLFTRCCCGKWWEMA